MGKPSIEELRDAKLDIEEIKRYCERLRADLSATNAALFSVFGSIPEVYRDRVLKQFAKQSVEREEFFARRQDPLEEQALELMQAAERRIYEALQGTDAARRAEGL
ncbi:hypothetical protein [Acidovorax sp. NCPPB 4044]|uniref:hypothetical protein n=1 Tax=Acidovorax sp. NCPPB 4044 TaxID=2940490 RepID=UPI0023042DE8|nr:hypothetical protein [Acidovorax sp. NCPPB 4044]MDA8522328.1 hypothetical protein [Acidovorax sp. NCPPB 4044]